MGIVGDAKAGLQQLLAELEGHTAGLAAQAAEGPWLAALREQVEKNAAALAPLLEYDGTPIRTHRLLREVRDIFPR